MANMKDIPHGARRIYADVDGYTGPEIHQRIRRLLEETGKAPNTRLDQPSIADYTSLPTKSVERRNAVSSRSTSARRK